MIARRGWGALIAATVALLAAAYTLNALLLLGGIAAFGAVAGELLLFHGTPPTAQRSPFVVERRGLPRALSPGVEAEVELRVRYAGHDPLRAEVRELLPPVLPLRGGRTALRQWWTPGGSERLRYRLRATSRGSHLVGPVTVVAESANGLAWRQWTVADSDRPLRVVPPAPIEHAYRIGPALLTQLQGRLALRRRGFGTEFRSLRPYQLSDDIRHVAWKRSRPGQLYVREFEQESRQDFVLLLDVTPSMVAGRPGENALDRAVEAGSLVIAAVARSGEDRVGLLTGTERPRQYLRPERGEYHFRRLAENLAYLRPEEGQFDLARALETLTARLVTHTHILAFSALDGPVDRLHRAHARFRDRGHRLYVFAANRAAFYPPRVAGLPGGSALRWSEEEERRRLDRRVSELRAEGIPVFPYDRRGAAGQVLATYTRVRAWGLA